MKTVIFVLAAIVAVNAQNTCYRTPVYTEKIDPIVCPKAGIKLPNYENASTYYQCGSVGTNGSLTSCATENYFSYVMQSCGPCESYLPSTICSALPFNATCVPIGSATTAPPATTGTATTATGSTATGSTATATTVAPSGSTASTAAPTGNVTTAAPTTQAPSTTSAVPEPPTDAPGSTTAGNSGDDTPSGTTIFIPQPPSPGESNVPTPVTPVPTAPNIEVTPPTVKDPPTQ
ncbi:peritrophin-55 [Drosophila pseudoobscura]|uniref:Peritrophin-55 n=1 Tax=Drosophila pseudoobscura pseudoobscura TaxID=46245 RepID=A0A6I8UNQ2_DROPS|nr:peritrophin-55 [Drosophila pseudoobscura]